MKPSRKARVAARKQIKDNRADFFVREARARKLVTMLAAELDAMHLIAVDNTQLRANYAEPTPIRPDGDGNRSGYPSRVVYARPRLVARG